jgi:hypothetical protein
MTALDEARAHLYRALESERSMMRNHYLWQAAAALDDAGFPGWSLVAEEAAQRTGGDDRDVRDLLFDVDREVGRREHAA